MSSATCMHTTASLLARQSPPDHPFAQAPGSSRRCLHRCRRAQAVCCRAMIGETVMQKAAPILTSSTAVWMLSQLPAQAEGTDFSQGSFSKESYYVTLGLFVLSVPGTPTVTSWYWTCCLPRVQAAPSKSALSSMCWCGKRVCDMTLQAFGHRSSVPPKPNEYARLLKPKVQRRKAHCLWTSAPVKSLHTSRSITMM